MTDKIQLRFAHRGIWAACELPCRGFVHGKIVLAAWSESNNTESGKKWMGFLDTVRRASADE